MNKPTDVNALLVMKSESTYVCYFYHRRGQIPNKKQLKGEQVYFDFWFEETQSVHRDGENGVSGVSQLLRIHTQAEEISRKWGRDIKP